MHRTQGAWCDVHSRALSACPATDRGAHHADYFPGWGAQNLRCSGARCSAGTLQKTSLPFLHLCPGLHLGNSLAPDSSTLILQPRGSGHTGRVSPPHDSPVGSRLVSPPWVQTVLLRLRPAAHLPALHRPPHHEPGGPPRHLPAWAGPPLHRHPTLGSADADTAGLWRRATAAPHCPFPCGHPFRAAGDEVGAGLEATLPCPCLQRAPPTPHGQ